MDSKGYIEFRISGRKGDVPLSPDSFDISEIRELITNFEKIAFASGRRSRPVVSYEQHEGSVVSRFRTKAQVVLSVAALLVPIQENPGLEFLELETAHGIEALQQFATDRDYAIEISTSSDPETKLRISRETNYHLASDTFVDADFYFYGEVSTIGGKSQPKVQIDTVKYGVLPLKTTREELEHLQQNLVYHVIGVHARGKQNLRDYEIDHKSLKLVKFLEYSPKGDRSYLNTLIAQASKSWAGIDDPDAWLEEIRGGAFAS